MASLTILTTSAITASATNASVSSVSVASNIFNFTPNMKSETFNVNGATIDTMLYVGSNGKLFYGVGSQQPNIFYDVKIIAHFKNSWGITYSNVLRHSACPTGFYVEEDLNLNSNCVPPIGWGLYKIEVRTNISVNGQSQTVSTYLEK